MFAAARAGTTEGAVEAPPPPAEEPAGEPEAAVEDLEEPAWEKPLALSVGLDYVLSSDYIFRGINFSEYPGEGRERVNHDLTPWAEYDTGALGTFGVFAWFWFYEGLDEIYPDAGNDFAEADYNAFWRYEIGDLGTTVEIGGGAYNYPHEHGSARRSVEVWGKISFDDSSWFGAEEPVLSPSIAYWRDVDDVEAGWLEIAVEHEFGLGEAPVLGEVAVTPSLILGVDHEYIPKVLDKSDPDTELGTLVCGLEVACDIGGALGIPECCGSLSIGGFVKYSHALRDHYIHDEFWGGFKASWSW
jgi:hypothetical protein